MKFSDKSIVTRVLLICGIFLLGVLRGYSQSAPVANTDSYQMAFGISTSISAVNGVLANDTDPDAGTVLTVRTTPVSGPANGALTLNADGSFTYTPNSGFTGSDSFQYQVCDDGSPRPIVSQFDFDTATLTAATVGPDATSVNPNAVQAGCGIRIPQGQTGGNVGIDVDIPNTGSIFNFSSFAVSFEYRDQESNADIVTAGNFRIYHISPNALGVRVDVIDGITGTPTSYTLDLGAFLSGSNLYVVEYDELSGNIIYTANGTTTTLTLAPANSPLDVSAATNIILGDNMDNTGRADPSLCFAAIQDTSKRCDTGTVNLQVVANVITNRRITYRVNGN